jgi:phosphopentomutase
LEHTRQGAPVLMFGSGIRSASTGMVQRVAMLPLTQGHYLYSRVLLWSAGRMLS